jgi:hypothetical protein
MTLRQMHHVLPYAHLFALERDAATGYLLQQLLFVWWIGIPSPYLCLTSSLRPRARFGSAQAVDASARIDAVSGEAGPEICLSRAHSQNGHR